MLVDCAVISDKNILNYWLSLCSKCHINNVLIHLSQLPSSRRHYAVKAVTEVGICSDTACSIISRLVVAVFVPKNSIITKFCRLMLKGLPHQVEQPWPVAFPNSIFT